MRAAARPSACAAAFAGVLLLTGCASEPVQGIETRPFRLSDLAKTDVDVVTEVHLEATLEHLRTLMEKLYRRNPREWKKRGDSSFEHVVADVFDDYRWGFPELQGKRGTECIELAFDDAYQGDRVLAFVAGLTSMVLETYGNRTEFYLLDQLDPQKLYNGARNVEIAVWRLASERDARGEPYLLSNSRPGEPRNLSFERLFGKIIAHQDAMAMIVANQTNRRIKEVLQRALTTAVFLPI